MTSPRRLFHAVTIVDADGECPDAWVLTDDELILAVGTGEPPPVDAERIDGAGGILTPGLIDLHRHGGGGHRHEDGVDGIRAAADLHAAHGTARGVASLVAAPVDVLESQLAAIASLTRTDRRVLGSHLEGPFLAVDRCGAHDPRHLIDPTPEVVQRLLDAAEGTLRQVTLDPQRPGALDAIGTFRSAGVAVAVGHTDATYAEAAAAFRAGATLLTHAFNAMPGLHHRAPGPVLAAVDAEDVVLELILDGLHVDPRLAASLFTLAPGRVALITDAMAAAGADDGLYRLGDLSVRVEGGRALVDGSDTLAGSTLTQDMALENARALGIPLPIAVEAVTLTPARALGLDDRLGLVRPGFSADVTLWDAAGTVRADSPVAGR
ncbi:MULTISPECIES: N-acetylglucosamine-6-phosphate deacetylase [Microbacterium]|uniref:N-acetylglucosamine-6-phosphate deacetylase n=1 Tax=Microbacterium TaxID=33882 RepID=UPI002784ABAE|nr:MULTISPECIES: N-acetylglucosamine-6-phosphate deacetylase [Microbacterium]MDQ1085011.1 N-acetylglucosamine-6-phosphate deacetylase [Microbacterium sp. SORGH_AS_0344]MDQ1169714.1 N-acetylglucosamine-6-phosphate deacetylase [Microbacterium proteolyticum]